MHEKKYELRDIEEEIMEAAFLACYAVSKAKLAETNQALGNALASPAYEKTEKL